MRIKCLILTLMLFTAGLVCGQPAQNPPVQKTAPSKPTGSNPTPSVPGAAVPESDAGKKPAESYVVVNSMPGKDRYDLASFASNVVLALVGVGGVIVGIITLIFLRRQTFATRIAADAALAQANHIANSERAWIEVLPYNWSIEFFPKWEPGDEIPPGPMGNAPISHRFVAQIKNVGKTPATIEGIAVRYIRSSTGPRDLEPEPNFGEIDTERFFLLPGAEIAAAAVLSPERGVLTKAQINAIKEETEFLYAYGVVRYKDVYQRQHETRFGYAYRVPETHFVMKDGKIESISFGNAVFNHGGPAAYNVVT